MKNLILLLTLLATCWSNPSRADSASHSGYLDGLKNDVRQSVQPDPQCTEHREAFQEGVELALAGRSLAPIQDDAFLSRASASEKNLQSQYTACQSTQGKAQRCCLNAFQQTYDQIFEITKNASEPNDCTEGVDNGKYAAAKACNRQCIVESFSRKEPKLRRRLTSALFTSDQDPYFGRLMSMHREIQAKKQNPERDIFPAGCWLESFQREFNRTCGLAATTQSRHMVHDTAVVANGSEKSTVSTQTKATVHSSSNGQEASTAK